MDQTIHAVVFILYLLAMLAIGIYFFDEIRAKPIIIWAAENSTFWSPP
jgi:hypothetical protein